MNMLFTEKRLDSTDRAKWPCRLAPSTARYWTMPCPNP